MALPAYSDPSLIEKAVGATLPAADVNKILGMVNAAFGSGGPVWTAFTPTLTQGVGVTITVTHARYAIIGKTAHVEIAVAATSSGTSGSAVELASIPAAIAPKYTDATATKAMGTAVIFPGSGNVRLVAVTPFSTTVLRFMADNIGGNWFGVSPVVQMISGGQVSMVLVYEIA